eukprot:g15932.t1
MCDVLGPPQLVCTFQRYDVYRSRTNSNIYIFGVDKVNKEYSCLCIPRKDEPTTTLELLEGEERFPLAHMDRHRLDMKQLQLEEVGISTTSIVLEKM